MRHLPTRSRSVGGVDPHGATESPAGSQYGKDEHPISSDGAGVLQLFRGSRVAALLIAAIMVLTLTGVPASADASLSSRMDLSPGQGRTAALSDRFLDGSTVATIQVPSSLQFGSGLYVANMLRASSGNTGYRAKVQIRPDGKMTVFLVRVRDHKETTLASKDLSYVAVAGGQIKIELAIAGTTSVNLKMRAFAANTVAPSWQVSAADSSPDRIASAGTQALWMYLSSKAPASTTVPYGGITTGSSADPIPTTPPTTPDSGASLSGKGSDPIGSTSYPIPTGAIFVSTSGSDSNSGTAASNPLRTIARALAIAPAGGTVVLRGGSYHESVMMPGHKALTIQSYPREAAWLDGSRVVTGFAQSGGTWVLSGWTTEFDSSPTYTRGAPDNTELNWQFVNPAYPMAAHPDQVWINDQPQKQVKYRSQVTAGSFFVDYASNQIVLGSDPTGKTVRSSALSVGITATAAGSSIRGIGIRRFAPSVPDKGALRIYGNNTKLENVEVTESATQGVTLSGSGMSIRKVTSSRNGLTGFETTKTDNLVVDLTRAEDNNRERFNAAPVAAGIKVHTSRGVTIKNSIFSGNSANGIWFDVSNYDARVIGNDVIGNSHDGVIWELSEKLLMVDNRITGNGVQSVFVLDAGSARIWNNTISGGSEPVRIHDTNRESTSGVSWHVKDMEFSNNIVTANRSGWCGNLCLLNDSDSRIGNQMARLNGNVYHRASATNPSFLVRWSGGKGVKKDYTSFSAFRSATGQESKGREIVGTLPTSGSLQGEAIPADVSSLLGLSAGSTRVGSVR